MKAKFNTGADIIRGKRQGFAFQSSSKGQNVQVKAGNIRPGYPSNFNRIYALCRASAAWSALLSDEAARWTQFAVNNPEPCRLNPNRLISGREMFIRRQVFEMTRLGMNCTLFVPNWETPDLANIPTLRVYQNNGRWLVDLYFASGWYDWISNIYVTKPYSPGQYAARKRFIFVGFLFPGIGELDITDSYINAFGSLTSASHVFFVKVSAANVCNPIVRPNQPTQSVHGAGRWYVD